MKFYYWIKFSQIREPIRVECPSWQEFKYIIEDYMRKYNPGWIEWMIKD